MKPIATLVLLIALLAVLGDAATRPDARVAAQDTPAAPGGTPVVAAAVVEPTATTEPTTEPHPEGTQSAGPAATTTPTAAEPTAMPEPSPTPEPWATEMPPPGETASETAAATPGAASVALVVAATEQTALTLTVAGDAVSFGQVSATGELDPAIRGLSSQVDERGASYVVAGAVSVTIAAGVPWTGACRAEENAGTASTVRVADGRLEWRLTETATWNPFVSGIADGGCFPRPEIGTRTFVYDLRLRIEATDPAGAFRTVLVFEAVP